MEPRSYSHNYSAWSARDILQHVDEAMSALTEEISLCVHSKTAPYHIALSLAERKDTKGQVLQAWVAKMEYFIKDADAAIEALSEKSCDDELEYEEYRAIIEDRGQHEKARSGLRAKISEAKILMKEAEAVSAPVL